jgi:hypothetical protein
VKVLFLPVSVITGVLAGLTAKKAFERLWAVIDDQEPPDAEDREVGYGKLATALLIEGALFRLVRGLFDHGVRRGFERLTGSWPGDERPETN